MANTLKIKRGTAATIPQGQLAEPLFTTDTYDLYIGKGSGGNQRIQNYIASGTSSQFLKGDGSLDSNTYQTALTFSSPLVNTSGTVTINQSSGTVDGYLSSTDWTTFNSKEPAITAGTTLQYYRGDKTFQTLDTSVVPENGPIYFTEPRVRATVLTGLNLSGGGTIAATDSILTAFGKVQNQISALVGGATYQGTWNASTNTPTLASGTGTKGYYYVVSVAGSTNLDGITDWKIGDWAIFNGTTWDKVDNTDAVSSVNGFTGAVNLALDNISDVSAASPTNAQLLRFNGTSSLWENWTPTFEPALTKGDLTSGDTSYLTVSGGTGAVIGSGTTISILASGIVNGGLTLTTTGNSGAATKTFATLNIPNYTLAGLGGVPTTRTITINGTAQDLSADRSWSVGTITGSGTASYVPKFTGASAIGNSQIVDDGTSILIGVTSDQGILQINGAPAGGLMINASDSQFGIAFKNSSSSNKKWDFSPQGNNLQFNESGVAPVLIFKAGGGNNVRLYSYASNGFLKTSSSDGTLIVDTTSYLPLTGGTLTGALSGTSATFSGKVGIGVTPSAWDSTFKILQISSSAIVNNADNDTFIGANYYYDGTNNKYINTDYAAAYGLVDGQHIFYTAPSGTAGNNITFTPRLTIANTGAATFSSSVTATQGNFNQTATSGFALTMKNRNATQQWGMVVDTSAVDGKEFGIYDITNSAYRFTISSTGAATFSSSVTATGLLLNGGSLIGNFTINGGTGDTTTQNAIQTFTRTSSTGNVLAGKIVLVTSADATNYGNLVFRVKSTPSSSESDAYYTNALTLGGSTGAATFSSSVKVNGTPSATSGILSVVTSTSTLGATADLGLLISNDGTAGKMAQIGFGYSESRSAAVIGGIISNGGGATTSDLFFATRSTTVGSDAPSERMRITSGGDMLMKTNGSKISWVRTSDNAPDVVYLKKDETISTNGTANLHGYDGIIFRTAGPETERMRITSGGNVGIGETNPGVKLHVVASGAAVATFASSAANGGWIRFARNTSSVYGYAGSGYELVTGGANTDMALSSELGNLLFATNQGAERMRITSGGNVGIGNSNPADYNANANNLVVGTTSGNTGITISSGNLSTGSLYFADGTTGNSEYRGYIEYQHGLDDLVIGTSAVARMTISGAGFYYLTNIAASSTANAANVYVNTTSGLLAYSTSSRKYKHDIRPYDRGINDLMKMNPVYYKGINDGNTQFAGLIAEEIDQLGMKEYVDYLNNEPNALRYSNMVTILVKAIQEQQIQIEELKSKLN